LAQAGLGCDYDSGYVSASTAGIPLNDVSFLASKQIRIRWTSARNATLGMVDINRAAPPNWIMQLAIFPVMEEKRLVYDKV
jgi:hypothetical protein